MIKRIASIIVVVLVNILILAHAVIPHHHHGDTPHFTFLTSHQHAGEDADDCCCNHLGEDNETERHDEGRCSLEQFVLVSPDNSKQTCVCAVCLHDHVDHLLQAVLFTIIYDLSLPDNTLQLRQPPYLITYHSIFASHSLGLRAPPVA